MKNCKRCPYVIKYSRNYIEILPHDCNNCSYEVKALKKLVILRGLPGSGKSKKAKELVGNGIIHSTDDFQIKNGIFVFDPENIGRYHRSNLIASIKSMEKGISPIIIDNTNVASDDCKNYVNSAKYYGYKIEVIEVETPWCFDIDELVKRNTHGVSREVIEAMFQRYETLEVFKRRLKIE